MKQKHYRVYLYPTANFIADKVGLMAIKSNGLNDNDPKRMTLSHLEGLFNYQCLDTPATGRTMTCTVNEHILTLDNNTGDKIECMLMIEEVELDVLQPEEPPYLPESKEHETTL